MAYCPDFSDDDDSALSDDCDYENFKVIITKIRFQIVTGKKY